MIIGNSVIVDIQLGNDMELVKWDAKCAKPICVSCLLVLDDKRTQNISIPYYKEMSEDDYKCAVQGTFFSLIQQGFKFYAINGDFLTNVLRGFFCLEITIIDIRKGLKGKGTGRDDLYRLLQAKLGVHHLYDSIDSSKDVHLYYEDYHNGDEFKINLIMQHSLISLQKCFYIMSQIDYIKQFFEIGKEGFVTKLKS